MSNQIVKTTQDAVSIGETFYKSGMFTDIKSAQQAIVKIIAGQELGIPPFAAMGGIHIIQGRPAIGAGLMASRIKGSGKYDYRVIEQTDKVCSIDFFQGKEKIGNSTFTIEDARKAQTKNMDKFPKNMLFARAISNGVKWFTPDIYSAAVYVPEEMEGIVTEDTAATVIEQPTTAAPDGVLPQSVYQDWIAEALTIADLTALKTKIPSKAWTPELKAIALAKHTLIVTPPTEIMGEETFNPENL
jgi:hypothetical protein